MNCKGIETSERLVSTVLTELQHGQIRDAVGGFAEEFRFTDCGLGLEFDDKERLTDYFQKARQLYPDAVRDTKTIFASGNDVITEWTLRHTITEPFIGGLSRRMPVVIQGVTFVRTKGGKITHWSEYYDGLTARRTALSAYFAEWVEL